MATKLELSQEEVLLGVPVLDSVADVAFHNAAAGPTMRMVPDRSQYSKRLVDPVCSAEWFLGYDSSHSDVRVRKGASCRSPSWGKA